MKDTNFKYNLPPSNDSERERLIKAANLEKELENIGETYRKEISKTKNQMSKSYNVKSNLRSQ